MNSENDSALKDLFENAREQKILNFKKILKSNAITDINQPFSFKYKDYNQTLLIHILKFFITYGKGQLPKYMKEMILLILEKGADVNIHEQKYDILRDHSYWTRGDWEGNTPLILACKFKDYDIVEAILKKSTYANYPNNNSITPLHNAARYGTSEIIELLLKNDNNFYGPSSSDVDFLVNIINCKDTVHEKTPLHFACYNYDENVAKNLIEKGAYVVSKDKRAREPLHIASACSNIMVMKLLIDTIITDYRYDTYLALNARDDKGQTPLHYVTSNNRNILGYHGDDAVDVPQVKLVNIKGSDNFYHKFYNHEKRLIAGTMLMHYSANPGNRDNDGKTPFEHHMSSNPKYEWKKDENFEEEFGKLIKRTKYKEDNYFYDYSTSHTLVNPSEDRFIHGDLDNILTKMTSTIKYTDENSITHDVPIITIPKGTLLFRSVGGDLDADFCGIKLNKNDPKYCLHKNHNVFFYPYPGYSSVYSRNNKISIFLLEKEIKLLNLRNPARIHRANKDDNDIYFKDCSTIEKSFCRGLRGRSYDPCFTEHFIEANPDIVGMITLAKADTVKRHFNPYYFGNLSEFSVFSQDVRGVKGIPEFILYPLAIRNMKELHWSVDKCKKSNSNNYSTFLETSDKDRLKYNIFTRLMQYLSPNGLQKKHVTIFNPLKMFVVWEKLDEKYKKDCVPLIFDNRTKLKSLQNDINKLNKPLYDEGRHIRTHNAEMDEIYNYDPEEKPGSEFYLSRREPGSKSFRIEEKSPLETLRSTWTNSRGHTQIDKPTDTEPASRSSKSQGSSTPSSRPKTIKKYPRSELKKHGQDCNGNYECTTGLCITNNLRNTKKCRGKGKNSRILGDGCDDEIQCYNSNCENNVCVEPKSSHNTTNKKYLATKSMGQECNDDYECHTKLCIYNNQTRKKRCISKGKNKRVIGDECTTNEQCNNNNCVNNYCTKK